MIERCQHNPDLASLLASAFALRWRLTSNEEDFHAAKRELQVFEDSGARRRLAVLLIEHLDFDEADALLVTDRAEGDVVATLMAVDIRLRTDRFEDALALLHAIPSDRITEDLRQPHAYGMGVAALTAGDVALKRLAAERLREVVTDLGELSSPFRELLEHLENDAPSQAAPSLLERLSHAKSTFLWFGK